MTLVTIYADAGHREDGASAAGGRIVRGDAILEVGGRLTRSYPSAQHAELAAIGAVILHGIRRGIILKGDAVEVLADNMLAIRYLGGNGPTKTAFLGTEPDPTGARNRHGKVRRINVYQTVPKDPEMATLARAVIDMLDAAGVRLKRARWVKGHNLKAGTEAAAANHRCDRLARSALRKSRTAAV